MELDVLFFCFLSTYNGKCDCVVYVVCEYDKEKWVAKQKLIYTNVEHEVPLCINLTLE